MELRAVDVLGTRGAGIVQVAAHSGYRVVDCDASLEVLERAQLCFRHQVSGLR